METTNQNESVPEFTEGVCGDGAAILMGDEQAESQAEEQVIPLTVAEARYNGICRVCRERIRPEAAPRGWQFDFREMVYPTAVTLNFGEEFAHTKCIKETVSEG